MRHHYPSAAAREREIVESYTYPHHEQTYDAFETDIAVLYVYFGQPTTTEYIRVVSLSWVGFLAQAGGLIGACLGFSFISLVEVIYWFIIRLIQRKIVFHELVDTLTTVSTTYYIFYVALHM